MAVLVHSLSVEYPVEDFSVHLVFRVSLDKLMQGVICLEELVEAAEYPPSEHDDALLESSSDHLLLILRFASTTTLQTVKEIVRRDDLLDRRGGAGGGLLLETGLDRGHLGLMVRRY